MTLTTCIFTNVVVGVDYVSCREKWKHWYRSREGEKGGGDNFRNPTVTI